MKYTQGSWTGFVGEDLVTIPRAFNSSFLANVATIFESENFFLPGIKWNGILGLAYATLAKVRRRMPLGVGFGNRLGERVLGDGCQGKSCKQT